MAKSKSRKRLEHRLRNGLNLDPRIKRGDWGVIDGVSKMTPTYIERKRRKENKHKGRNRYDFDYRDHTYFSVI